MATSFNRSQQNVGNIVLLEHINLKHPDQQLATLFYIVGLQFTRDPYLLVGLDNMWVNLGRHQFHLPTHPSQAQVLRGHVGIIVPDLDDIEQSLQSVAPALAHTRFEVSRHSGHLDVWCPWGNHLRCYAASSELGSTELGIAYIECLVGRGNAAPIAEFYRHIFGASTNLIERDSATTAAVAMGPQQMLYFRETTEAVPAYDGHHIQIYIADFSGPYEKLRERELITRETDEYEWRFIDIVDIESHDVLFQIEHEVRSMTHPLFNRPLVNRNPQQNNRHYVRGQDAFRGTY